MASQPTKLLFVDPYPAVLEGLALLAEQDDGLEVSATASTAAEARAKLAEVAIDIVVVARELADDDGVRLCAEISELYPTVRCIVHSAGEIEPNDLANGAVDALVLKQLSGTDLLDTIQDLATRPTTG